MFFSHAAIIRRLRASRNYDKTNDDIFVKYNLLVDEIFGKYRDIRKYKKNSQKYVLDSFGFRNTAEQKISVLMLVLFLSLLNRNMMET